MYQVHILDEAARELEQLDKSIYNRIVQKIRWLAANFEQIKIEKLRGDLAEFYKLRVGDYRIIYEIIHSEKIIIIHAIGHHNKIYRKK